MMASSEHPTAEDIIHKDYPLFEKLLSSADHQLKDVISVVKRIQEKISPAEGSGMSFLDMKNHLMISYLQNLTFLMMKKAAGQPIENSGAILRIVEIRTVLEKMRPMEHKLKYYIDKLLKDASGALAENDPLQFRPNPDQLTADDEEEDEEETDEEDNDEEEEPLEKSGQPKSKSNIYVPPRLAAVPYDLDTAPQDKREKQQKRAKMRALHGDIMQEIRQEHLDEPEEIHDRDIYRTKTDKRAKAIEQFEETNMVRLNKSRKDKARERKMMTMGSLGQLADFQDFRAMTDNFDDESFGRSANKRKKAQKTKGKKQKWKKFKKRH